MCHGSAARHQLLACLSACLPACPPARRLGQRVRRSLSSRNSARIVCDGCCSAAKHAGCAVWQRCGASIGRTTGPKRSGQRQRQGHLADLVSSTRRPAKIALCAPGPSSSLSTRLIARQVLTGNVHRAALDRTAASRPVGARLHHKHHAAARRARRARHRPSICGRRKGVAISRALHRRVRRRIPGLHQPCGGPGYQGDGTTSRWMRPTTMTPASRRSRGWLAGWLAGWCWLDLDTRRCRGRGGHVCTVVGIAMHRARWGYR